jgi:hypothetical protein
MTDFVVDCEGTLPRQLDIPTIICRFVPFDNLQFGVLDELTQSSVQLGLFSLQEVAVPFKIVQACLLFLF